MLANLQAKYQFIFTHGQRLRSLGAWCQHLSGALTLYENVAEEDVCEPGTQRAQFYNKTTAVTTTLIHPSSNHLLKVPAPGLSRW